MSRGRSRPERLKSSRTRVRSRVAESSTVAFGDVPGSIAFLPARRFQSVWFLPRPRVANDDDARAAPGGRARATGVFRVRRAWRSA
ncbi:hypothetical protein GCM10011428_84360 [Streptomyces violaceus]